MADEKKITCPDCEADIAQSEIENGRCPKCQYNIQAHIDAERREAVRERQRAKEQPEKKEETNPLRRGLLGYRGK